MTFTAFLARWSSAAFLAAGVLVAPWLLVFAAWSLLLVRFRWYGESAGAVVVSSALSGVPLWRMLLAWGIVLVSAEWIRERLDMDRSFAYWALWALSAGIGTAVSVLAL